MATGYWLSEQFLARMHVGTIAEVRALSTEMIVDATTMEHSFWFYPTLDYSAIPEKYLSSVKQTAQTKSRSSLVSTEMKNSATESGFTTVKAIIKTVNSTYGICALDFLEVYQHANANQVFMTWQAELNVILHP
ncbi:hypothetical protein N7510_011782 [Penicillium lagena]|uniref:uncharacterized protein n=1 Tax=Penicillium lagena TaxID=94218 RepID=UPI00253FCEFD|nr:uncharacterized protein N7510_011782 [Penicillium lagena]KAJ5602248.1 hypothetical protein N7510_011782 [Penicillium lagena]